MRTQSDKKLKTEKVLTSRDMFSSLATAETVRTASHVMIAGNTLFSAHLAPLVSISLNSLFSTLATSITYGRTPQKIQQARLEDLKMLIENSRPLFAPEMQILFSESASYQALKKQFENLNQKYSARIETKPKIFQYLMFAIGIMGAFYFVARLLQEKTDSDVFRWTEAAFVMSIMSLMGYSNFQSHQELVMRSRKDYQEFIEVLIQFATHVTDEVPILKVIATLKQTQKEMKECVQELKKLGVEMPEIREAEEGGVEESKGEEKSLMQRVEERLQSLVGEREQEIEEIRRKVASDLQYETSEESKISIKQKAEIDIQDIQSRCKDDYNLLQTRLKKLWHAQKEHNTAHEELQRFYEKFTQSRSIEMSDDDIRKVEEALFNAKSTLEKETNTPETITRFGMGI